MDDEQVDPPKPSSGHTYGGPPQQLDNDGFQLQNQITPKPVEYQPQEIDHQPQQIPDYQPQEIPPADDYQPKTYTTAPGAVHPFPKRSGQGYPARQTAPEYPHGLTYTTAPGAVRPFPKRADMYSYQPLAPQQQSTNNVTVVNTQPSATLAINHGPKPKDYMILSIITCFFCCWIFGLIAIMYSSRVNSSWSSGDYDGARGNSRTALQWNIVTIVAGFIFSGIYFCSAVLCSTGILRLKFCVHYDY